MADVLSTKITGLDLLAKTLEQDLPEQMAKSVIRDALESGADVAVDAMETAAKGEIKEDIVSRVTVKNTRDGLVGTAVIGPGYRPELSKTRKRGKYAGQQDPTTNPGVFPLFVEKGHGPAGSHAERQRAKRSGVEIEFGSGNTPPHPFAGPSFQSSKDQALEAIVSTLRSGIDDAARAVRKN